ncbi:MAG TPA: aldo/keto reductase [Bacteroides sp.]|nr:aldo/keto reductase [Bacteroides sp.]
MKIQKRNFTRKEFIKTSSLGAIATGILAGSPLRAIADPGKNAGAGQIAGHEGTTGSGELAKSMLGKTGIEMTRLGVGAPRIQEPNVLKYALDSGVTFIDTGRIYANGKNEIMVGEVVKGRRKDLVIQSKLKINEKAIEGKLNSEATSAKIRDIFNKSLDESLAALQTDYIDVMLFHDGSTNELLYHETVLESFTKAKKEGKIRAFGYSVHYNLIERIKQHNENPFYDVVMYSFNPHGRYKNSQRDYTWDQETLMVELEKAANSGTGIVAMKTCLGGPWCCEGDEEKTYPGSVKWVLQKPYIHTSAVAMASFQQLDEHLAVHKN